MQRCLQILLLTLFISHFRFVNDTQSPLIHFDFAFSFLHSASCFVLLSFFCKRVGAKYEMSGYQLWLSLAVVE